MENRGVTTVLSDDLTSDRDAQDSQVPPSLVQSRTRVQQTAPLIRIFQGSSLGATIPIEC
ncbi:hypothetical protein N7454_008734 [Penicillium verhagenii]|nr:hypothetical protein N7454_008734 [Penicillium verhagenii]